MTRRKTRNDQRDRSNAGGDTRADAGDDDGSLFRRLMADAKPLEHDRTAPHRRRARPRATFARRDREDVLRESLAQGPPPDSEAGAGDHLRFARPSVSHGALRRLARGGYCVQAEIDLHGLTGAEARVELGRFIAECVGRGLTCVRVIHGKGHGSGHGGPVLKRLADYWLRHWDPVLAFVSARPVDGGSGAVYVLLRRG